MRKGSSLREYEVRRGLKALWKFGHEFTDEEQRDLRAANPWLVGDAFDGARWFTRMDGRLDRRYLQSPMDEIGAKLRPSARMSANLREIISFLS